jgi:acyl carrier protein
MGLDLVELVLAFEEAFDVSINAPTWQGVRTPRQLIAHLSAVLPLAAPACPSQQAFYAVRRGIVRTWRIPRARVRPSTPWTALLPRSNARQRWASLGASVSAGYWPQRWIVGGPRADHATVGALATFLASTQPARVKRSPVTWTAQEIETVVRAVMYEELGLKDVALEADFVTDLGIS